MPNFSSGARSSNDPAPADVSSSEVGSAIIASSNDICAKKLNDFLTKNAHTIITLGSVIACMFCFGASAVTLALSLDSVALIKGGDSTPYQLENAADNLFCCALLSGGTGITGVFLAANVVTDVFFASSHNTDARPINPHPSRRRVTPHDSSPEDRQHRASTIGRVTHQGNSSVAWRG